MNADLNPPQRSAAPPMRRTHNPPGLGPAFGAHANAQTGGELFAALLQAAEAEAAPSHAGDSKQPKGELQGETAPDAPAGGGDPSLKPARPSALAAALKDALPQVPMPDASSSTAADRAVAPGPLSAPPTRSSEGVARAAPSHAAASSPGRLRGTGALPAPGAAASSSARALEQAHSQAAFLRAEATRAQAAPALPTVLGLPVSGWPGAPGASANAFNFYPSPELSRLDADTAPADSGRAGGGVGTGSSAQGGSQGGNGAGNSGTSGYGLVAGTEPGSTRGASGETAAQGGEFGQQLDAALSSDGWSSVFEPLGHQISLWAAGQTRKAQLLLHEGLRQTLQVELRLDDAQAHLDFYTDDAQLRDALLAQARDALGELLGRSGLELAGLSVGARAAGDTHANGQDRREAATGAPSANRPEASSAPASVATERVHDLRLGAGRAGLSVYV